ncbi:MAG: restriction endonuclease subunit S [Pseudomonadota bacterium]|nr:restriction endonuclease subunit S [Pseudomonadota bacterium]
MNFNFISIGSLINSNEASLQTGPFGTQLKASEYVEFGTPVINVRNIGFGDIRADNLEYITDFKAEQLKNHLLCKGDIVFGRKGAVERHSYIQDEQVGWVQGSDCLRLRLNTQKVDSRLLSYYFKTQPHQDWMHALCAFGATMASLNQDIVRRILFPCPSISVQRKIVAILSAYDDLIENNKKRIQILENMAEELYKEWFVRLRFPNWENTEFEKGIPKDWKIINSGEFIDVVKGKSYTSPEIHDEFIDESLPFINLKNFNRGGGYRRNGLKFYTGKYANNQKTYQDDIVMAVTDMTQDRAVVGRVARVPKLNFEFAIISLDCVKLVPKIYSSTFTYCYFKYSGFSDCIKEFANGANVLHLSPNQIGKQKILIPPKELVDSFEAIVVPIYSELNILEESNEKLEVMRNNLLPRLISGKLSVENLDIQFPPSMQEQ